MCEPLYFADSSRVGLQRDEFPFKVVTSGGLFRHVFPEPAQVRAARRIQALGGGVCGTACSAESYWRWSFCRKM